MSKKVYLIGAALIVLLGVGYWYSHRPVAGEGGVGGVIQATRTTYTTIDGGTASSTAAGPQGVYINSSTPTSTLIAAINDVDDLTFFGALNASSSATANVNVRFWESDYAGCNNNNASTTWYELTTVTPVNNSPIVLASSTLFSYAPAASTTVQGFAFNVPYTPAQCIMARVTAQPGTTNFQIWYGFASQRKGYNTQ